MTAADSPFSARHRALSVGVLMMVTVVAFQALGIATALPAVARELGGLSAYGWGFSAFLLAEVGGLVAAGQAADARGPVRPFIAGVCAFACGSVLAAAAGTWSVLLFGRALQGAGVGAVSALVYVAVARAYPPVLYGRMMALLSSAWVIPSLVGPALGGFVAEHFGWRWVFLMLLPLLPVAAALALPGLRALEREEPQPVAGRLGRALALIAGLGLLLAALELNHPLAVIGVAVAGAAIGAPAFRRLLPAGTLRARRGLPSGIAVRGLLAVAFLGCDAFLPLGLTRLRDLTLAEAGLVISTGSLAWSVGALVQGRLDRADGGRGRPSRVLLGLAILPCGIGITGAALLAPDVTPLLAGLGWMVAGFGIGVAYPSAGALALSQAPDGAEGSVSSALQLIEAIGVAVFTGVGGAIIAAGLERGWSAGTAIAVIFAAGVTAALTGLPTGRRVAAPQTA